MSLKIQNSRQLLKRTKEAGLQPIIATGSTNHTDGTWLDYEIYPGELYLNMQDKKLYFGAEDISGNTSIITANPYGNDFGLPATLQANNTTSGNNIVITNGDFIKNSTDDVNIELNSTGISLNAPGGPNFLYIDTNLVPLYDDDADAAAGGLTAGQIYQTKGGGAPPLDTVGILMIKQP
jgi:hypothetical protein